MPRALTCSLMLCGLLSAQTSLRGVLLERGRPGPAGAEVVCQPDPPLHLPALDGLLPPPPALAVNSDARGQFRFDGVTGTGLLLARTPSGLGALLPRCRAGEAAVLHLLPMAEVGLPGRSETFRLWAACRDAGGRTHFLPEQQGEAVRLPAGDYEVWFQLGEAFAWARLELHSGERVELTLPAAGSRLQRAGRIDAHPDGWPQVQLFPGDSLFCSLRGDAAQASLTSRVESSGLLLPSQQVPRSAELLPQVWPPLPGAPLQPRRFQVIQVDTRAPVAGAQVTVLRPTARADRWQAAALTTADAAGQVSLATATTGGELWLLVTAPGMAPRGLRLDQETPTVLALAPENWLEVQCAAAADVDDVCLEYLPAGQPVALQRARTDPIGGARFCVADGHGRLLVSDPRFANADVAVAPGQTDARLQLEPGAALQGHAVFAGDQPAAGVVVMLRDPTGMLRPAERSAVVQADGAFRFQGLSANADYVLFAQSHRDGRTFSGKLAPARADGSRYVLELRCEDPELPRGGR